LIPAAQIPKTQEQTVNFVRKEDPQALILQIEYLDTGLEPALQTPG